MVTGLHTEHVDEYQRLHAAVWPDVLNCIARCNIRNYSIYFREIPGSGPMLFSYFEYSGSDFEADMALMAEDEATQKWWALCNPCQRAVVEGEVGNTWVTMDDIFHQD